MRNSASQLLAQACNATKPTLDLHVWFQEGLAGPLGPPAEVRSGDVTAVARSDLDIQTVPGQTPGELPQRAATQSQGRRERRDRRDMA